MMNKKIKETSSRPEEVYLQILLRVEARSTYACKCVCKTWLSLISDPGFIKKHLNLTHLNLTLQKNKPYLMLRSQDEASAIHTISHDSEFDDEGDAVEVDYPFSLGDRHDGVSLLGSCNGLVALGYAATDLDCNPRDIIRIWNPVTREIKLLPQSPNSEIYDEEQIVICAFGYDYKIDDYKMAKVVEPIEDEGTSLDIYTLGTDSWKSIHQPIPYKFPYNRVPGVLVDGNFHWLGETCGENVCKVVVSFNISDENFEAIHLPNESLESTHFLRSVGLLEGCLCVLANAVDVGIEIWIMQEYGVQASWKKHYVISHELFLNVKKSCLDFLNDYNHFIRLVLSIMNGEILFATSGMLLIYNPELGTLRESNISIPMHWCESDNYFESLVPIGSGNYYIEGVTKDDDDEGDGDEDDEKEEEDDMEEEGLAKDDEAEDEDDEEEEEDDIEEEDSLSPSPTEENKAADISCPQCGTGFGGFQCNGTTAHLQCHVCGGMMPSRTNTSVPQHCLGCDRAYCGAYWLSQGVPTSNSHTICSPETFKPIAECTISEMPALTHENNRFEKDITERCIRQSGRTLQDVISEWIATFNSRNIDRSRLQLNHAEMITSGTHLCKDCYDKLVSFLLYWYRVTTLKHTLPPDASTREDCWYGYSCRTQHHSEDHARKRNHVCRPTRGSHFVRTT